MSNEFDRRSFLGVSTAGVAAAALPGAEAAAHSAEQASIGGRPVRLGFVGVGDRGSHHLDIALGIDGIEIPAICDIAPHYLYRAKRWIEEAGKPAP